VSGDLQNDLAVSFADTVGASDIGLLKIRPFKDPAILNLVGSEVLAPVVMKSSVSWDITPCGPLKVSLRFGGTSSSSRNKSVSK
jgi:hypothetical protein